MHCLWNRIRTTVDPGHGKFFRTRLLSLDNEQISKYIDKLDQEAAQIKQESFKLAWYMRGGISYHEVLHLSNAERQAISDLAKENIETTKKTNLPWF